MLSKKILITSAIFTILISAAAVSLEKIEIVGKRFSRSIFEVFDILNYSHMDYMRFEPLFSGGGGGTSSLIRESFCNFLDGEKPDHCKGSPDASVFAVNGCSVPDNFPSMVTAWKSTFNGPCNNHDMCYVLPGAIKSSCDKTFRQDMDIVCMTDPEISTNRKLRDSCFTASLGYATAVAASPTASDMFEVAQDDVKCDAWHTLKDKYCE